MPASFFRTEANHSQTKTDQLKQNAVVVVAVVVLTACVARARADVVVVVANVVGVVVAIVVAPAVASSITSHVALGRSHCAKSYELRVCLRMLLNY